MTLALKRAKVYLKVGAIVAVVLVGLLVFWMNRGRTADVWFFREYSQIPVLWLILITGTSSILGWWGVRKVIGVVRDLRELRRARESERQLSEQRRLADQLAEREKRIDEKVRRSLTEDAPSKEVQS
ncbi:MAG: hypothetical protein GXY55_19275 [Phycisphaerae bacterium]|nr:hypothetical protein [Phycisphaerae bacterium]